MKCAIALKAISTVDACIQPSFCGAMKLKSTGAGISGLGSCRVASIRSKRVAIRGQGKFQNNGFKTTPQRSRRFFMHRTCASLLCKAAVCATAKSMNF